MRLVIDKNTITRFKLIHDFNNDSEHSCVCRLCLHNYGYIEPYSDGKYRCYHCAVGSHCPGGNFFQCKHLYICKNFRLISNI